MHSPEYYTPTQWMSVIPMDANARLIQYQHFMAKHHWPRQKFLLYVLKEWEMAHTAFQASAGSFLDSYDFNQNYHYLKRLIEELKMENRDTVRERIFGEGERGRNLTKREMKQLFKFLRKIENHYEECRTPPIPVELEKSIRSRETTDWLPWELEAIEKVDGWRSRLKDQKLAARDMFTMALARIRNGEKLP